MQKERFESLDLFRGATLAFMILVNNPGNGEFTFTPLEHAAWHGLTPTDLVFPFFLFAVGNAMAFVMPRLEAGGEKAFWSKVLRRSALIFLIGLFLNWFPFVRWTDGHWAFRHWVNPDNPETGVRILGVLQRIALCYFFASIIIYYLKARGAFYLSIVMLLLYWILCYTLGTPGDPYSLPGYFGTAIDKAVLGTAHLYRGEHVPFDPEGIASTLPAITEVVFGYLVGQYIREKGKNFEMLSKLFVTGCVLVFLGFCWDMVFPINKKIWTSSYVVYTTGLAILLLGVMIDIVEFRQWKGILTPAFGPFGKNPLFIYFLSGFIPRLSGLLRWTDHEDEKGQAVYTTPLHWFSEHVCQPVSQDLRVGSLLYALCLVVFFWVIAYWMNRKKIYIRV